MEATSEEIYNHSESYTGSTHYESRNTVCFNMFTHLVANPPTDWTVISSSIPTASTSAYLEYNAVLEGQGFRIKLYTSTDSTYKVYLYVDIQNTSGTTLLSANSTSSTAVAFITNSSYYYQLNLIMTSYYTASKLYTIILSSTWDATNKRVIAKIYTENKATGAEDFLITSDFYASGARAAASTSTKNLWYSNDYMRNSSSQYAAISCYAYNSNTYYAKLINTYMITNGSILSLGRIYSDGIDSYLRIGNAYTALIKL